MVEIQTLLNKRDGKNHFCTEPDCKPCGVAACGGKADATKAKPTKSDNENKRPWIFRFPSRTGFHSFRGNLDSCNRIKKEFQVKTSSARFEK